MDFMHLSDVLFDEYKTITDSSLESFIKSAKSNNELPLDVFKNFIPMSNWDRHFAKIINYDGSKLKRKWSELSLKRNDVAHNKPILKADYQMIKSLTEEIKPIIIEAIQKLDFVHLTVEEKEQTLESSFNKHQIRLGKAATIYNVGMDRITKYLSSLNYYVENNANYKIPVSAIPLLDEKFGIPK
jgi:hypothetical protein